MFEKIKYNINVNVSSVFMHLFIGLVLAGIFSGIGVIFAKDLIFGKYGWVFTVFWVLMSVGIALASGFFARDHLISNILYYTYCIIMGIGLSYIFFVYKINTIFTALIGTGVICLILSIIAEKNILDLRNFGFILLIITFVIIILSLINLILLKSTILETAITSIVLILFSAWFIYDLQVMEELLANGFAPSFVALSLFIDIINIFLSLLELLGNRE